MDDLHIVIDFDSTFIQVEALEELASISLGESKNKEDIIRKLQENTKQSMEGKLSYARALKEKIDLLKANKEQLHKLTEVLKNKITPSIERNKGFFGEFSDRIYIVSGGFKEFIWPIIEPFSLLKEHLFANSFLFDYDGNIVGYNESNVLSQNEGKSKLLDKLSFKGETIIIGDGYTDYEASLSQKNRRFFAFTENIRREPVVKMAEREIDNFDLFIKDYFPSKSAVKKLRKKALLLENIHSETVKQFTKKGFEVELLPSALSEEELIEKIQDISILGIRSKTRITKKILDHAEKLIAIGSFCIGTDNIDANACLKKGVATFNAPYSNTRSVVELAMGEIIMLLRKIFVRNEKLHRGVWDKGASGSVEVREKKLGIIGYGNIGSQLSVLAEAMGMQVCYYDLSDKLPLGNAKKCDSLSELLKNSDVVSIHVSGEMENVKMIGEEEFKIMKEGSIFLNLSRGEIVDLSSLAKYIKNGTIRGAALDVFPNEPKGPNETFSSDLQKLPNVILTPHIGGSTMEAQESIAYFVSKCLLDYFYTGSSRSSVNFPEVRLPGMKHTHRLIHLHKNVSGILAEISGILAKHKINIEGQYLKTNDKVGYVIVDTNSPYTTSLIEELRSIENTIRVRTLY